MKSLTKAEEEVMQHLWELEKAFVKEVVAEMPEPKPAYNTVSTIIRILEQKGFVGYQAYGKSHQYFPLVSKEDYSKYSMSQMVQNYFGGSFKRLVSFFANEENLSLKDLEEIKQNIEKTNSK